MPRRSLDLEPGVTTLPMNVVGTKADRSPPVVRKVELLQALRLKLHRLGPSRPLRDTGRAAAFVKERRIVMSTGRSSLPLLTEAIAGRPLAGSWMAHLEADRIYSILGDLAKYDVVVAPLILGKQVAMAASLGPAVERIASDPARRDRVLEQIPPLARRLLDQVEAEARVRMDRWSVPTKQARAARLLLERELLVVSSGLHTESGYHTSVVEPWARSKFSKRFSKEAARLTSEEAQDQLLLAAVRSAVTAPEREVRHWFVFGTGRIETLLAQAKLERLTIDTTSWLTCPQ